MVLPSVSRNTPQSKQSKQSRAHLYIYIIHLFANNYNSSFILPVFLAILYNFFSQTLGYTIKSYSALTPHARIYTPICGVTRFNIYFCADVTNLLIFL